MNGPSIQSIQEQFPNLASARLGARIVAVTDEFFAPCERMLSDAEPVFIPGKFDDHGKWMDGWESRRKREPGHDWCIVRLAAPGRVYGVEIDTRHFIGNHPPFAAIEGCWCDQGDPDESTTWRELLTRVPLNADSRHPFLIEDSAPCTHLRLDIFPDGGVARLRVHGEVICEHWPEETLDLFAFDRGGRPLACSHQGFGSSMFNLNRPGRGRDMGDGWETPRRRGEGHDWVILKLGRAGTIEALELDTAFFRGNFPHEASADGALLADGASDDHALGSEVDWKPLLDRQRLSADAVHRFDQLLIHGPCSHVRINIHPDGGLSRVRVWGFPRR